MPIKPQDHDLIEKFLLDQLSSEEKDIFESRLQDPDFSNELEIQADLMAALKSKGRDQIKSDLVEIENRIAKPGAEISQPKIRLGRIFAIAASISIIFFAWYFYQGKTPQEEQLFAKYFEPYPNLVNPIDKSIGQPPSQGDPFRLYELEKYVEAIQQFGLDTSKSEAVYFYKGLSELALGNASEALSDLELIRDKGGTYYTTAQWYKALANLKTDGSSVFELLEYVENNAKTDALKEKAEALKKELD